MRRWLEVYYWGTVVFAMLDWIFDIDIRLAALEGHPVWKAVYYVACLGIAFMMRRAPRLAGLLALLESSVNLLLLILALLVPYYGFINALASGEPAVGMPIDRARIINFLLSGAMWSVGYFDWARKHHWSR